MSKRLQVMLPDAELLEIQRFARRERLTAGEWVHRTLRDARLRQPGQFRFRFRSLARPDADSSRVNRQ